MSHRELRIIIKLAQDASNFSSPPAFFQRTTIIRGSALFKALEQLPNWKQRDTLALCYLGRSDGSTLEVCRGRTMHTPDERLIGALSD